MNASVSMLMYSLLSAFLIVYTAYTIRKIKINIKKREDFLIMQLNNKFNTAWLYLIFVIIWITIFTKDITNMYMILNGEHMSSIFQLFNLKYIESLSNYFYENGMIIESYETLRYPRDFMNNLYWIIASICILTLNVYREKIKIALYNDGVLITDKFYKKDDLLLYEWGGAYENTILFKGVYCNLVLKKHNLFGMDRELSVRVNYSDKEKIDDILKYTYNLEFKDDKGEK